MQPDEKATARRERMSADKRQAAILDAAAQLLAKQGWEEVTINDILDAAGISRGGFYHHFSSKDDVLKELVLRFADAASAAARSGMNRSGTDYVDRLSMFLHDAIQWELDHSDEIIGIVSLAMRPGNGPIFLGLSRETERRTLPVLREILSEGVERRTFDLVDVGMTADLFLRVARTRWLEFIKLQQAAREGRHAEARGSLHQRIQAERQTYERLLGLPPGSIELPPEHAFEKLLR
ncbi:hypothetical protein A3731_36870 [Roseovarius sp. HI0049]|nr:hypothetical protein A3731_05440 [Roseovarius sp. HI0049]KZY40809.1 hypothetical protein A3731_36870 [Roseovarius sp. HI0049]